MNLIILEFSSFQNGGLSYDFFLNCVGQIVVDRIWTLKDISEILFIIFLISLFIILFLSCTFLH